MTSQSRHEGSLPENVIPLNGSTCESSVEASVEGERSSTVEPLLPKQDVAGSNPVARSEEQAARDIVEFAAKKNGETPEKKEEIASEGGHWYLPDGTPYYTYVNKKGETKNVTLRQARLVNAYPSVTGVTGILNKTGLNIYHQRHVFDAVIRLMRADSEKASRILNEYDAEALEKWWKFEVREAAGEHSKKASDRGTALHAEIERFLRGDLIHDKSWLPHIANIVRVTCQLGINIREGQPEKSFGHRFGFGGKVDYHSLKDTPVLIDFKSKEKIDLKKKYGTNGHKMQLAAYREGLGLPDTTRCINIFVGCEDRQIMPVEWTRSDIGQAWEEFKLLLRIWKMENKYYPKGIKNNGE